MTLDDRLLGAAVALGGGAYTYVAFGLPDVFGQAYGPGFFPSIIGVATTLAGLALAARGTARAARARLDAPTTGDEPAPHHIDVQGAVRFTGILASVVFYVLVADTLGFALTSLVIIAALGLLLGGRLVTTVLVAIGATVLFLLVFGRLLRVPLPVGPLDLL